MKEQYYANANPDLLSRIPLSARRILEIGCGQGALAKAYRHINPQAHYSGVELFSEAAHQARTVLDAVVSGDIEQPPVLAELDQALAGQPFDTLIFGDVLEHLRDPWALLQTLRQRCAPSGLCVACIPNIAHWSILQGLLQGRWDYADSGLLDRTHLRFFTLQSAIDLFTKAGWTVVDAAPRVFAADKAQAAIQRFEPVASALGIPADQLRRNLSALQWVIRAVNGPAPKPLVLASRCLPKQAGVTEARIDHPLSALSSLPGVRAVWSSASLQIPKGWPAGVLILHRQFMNDATLVAQVEALIAKGWITVADMDDDPHHWPQYAQTNFRAFRGVHAVTVSTEPLAQMMRQWNPNVQVFANAIAQLPVVPPATPKAQPLRIFFGALNRQGDWGAVQQGLFDAAAELGQAAHWVVVHDRAFYDALPAGLSKEFHATQPPQQYMALLAGCDINLLPLADTPFNRLKSDLKFIESCACQAVPICSPVVYDQRPEHLSIGVFAQTPSQWRQALIHLCTHPEELAQRRQHGLQYVRQHRMHAQQVQQRHDYYTTLIQQYSTLETQRQQRLATT